MNFWPDIEHAIGEAAGAPFVSESRTAVGGGCINAAYRVSGGGCSFFVKTNDATRAGMFAAEALGLALLAATNTVRVPRPLCHGANENTSWLVLEFVALGHGGKSGMRQLGRELAAMHKVIARTYGWEHDNTIGATPQPNTPSRDWIAFWREQRLRYQLELAVRNGHARQLEAVGQQLLEQVSTFFRGYAPPPSLLHGDLWTGNVGFDGAGRPVIFDPAVYYGDREADLAMTELFGGYPADFYAAYREAWPLDPGYQVRRDLYNLYHVLNHLNLFGAGYLGQARRLIEKLLAAV